MIFYAGIVLLILGVVLFVKFLITRGRPKEDATVLALLKEAPPGQFIDQPHALVEYYFNGNKLNTKVLLRSKPQVGGTIKIAIKPESPTKATEYYPKAEIGAFIGATVLGAVLIVVSMVLSDMIG